MVLQQVAQHDQQTEERAVAAASGDRDALGDLYEQYADPLLRYIRLRVGNDLMAAEDVAATTWERVAKGIRTYETKGNGFPAWLFTIARRTAIEHGKTLSRRREFLAGEFLADEHPDVGASTEELYESKLRSHHLAAAVRALSPKQRRCVTLRFYVGLSIKDTAAVMGLNENAVKQCQHRALGMLRGRIGHKASSPNAETVVTVLDGMQVERHLEGKAK